jgi:hypothetical protein
VSSSRINVFRTGLSCKSAIFFCAPCQNWENKPKGHKKLLFINTKLVAKFAGKGCGLPNEKIGTDNGYVYVAQLAKEIYIA